MGPEPLGCVSGTLLVLSFIPMVFFIKAGIAVSKDKGPASGWAVLVIIGLAIVAIIGLCVTWVPSVVIVSVGFMLIGLAGMVASVAPINPTPPSTGRGRGLWRLAYWIGGYAGVRILYLMAGLIIFFLGYLGLTHFFGLPPLN